MCAVSSRPSSLPTTSVPLPAKLRRRRAPTAQRAVGASRPLAQPLKIAAWRWFPPPKGHTMPRLLQQLLSPLQSEGAPAQRPADQQANEDGFALGWESANPALQFEGWEPAPVAPQSGAVAC